MRLVRGEVHYVFDREASEVDVEEACTVEKWQMKLVNRRWVKSKRNAFKVTEKGIGEVNECNAG